MKYVGAIYRPPSEARSLIVQVTYGCSHGRCAFCCSYLDKPFALRPLEEVLADFREARAYFPRVEKIFLADGDALVRDAGELEVILDTVAELFPECVRVSCYASPRSLEIQSEEALRRLRSKGLAMVYLGLESGCDEVLRRMRKGCSAAGIVEAGKKARRCGLALSVTAIAGLGGPALSERHARETASALNAMNPEYIGMLTLMVPQGTALYQWVQEGSFTLLTPEEDLAETALLLKSLDSPGSVFRMNHASNYLDLRGTLNRDRAAMLEQVEQARRHLDRLRPESWRGL